MLFRVPEALVNIAHFLKLCEFGALERLTAVDLTPALIARCPSDGLISPGGRSTHPVLAAASRAKLHSTANCEPRCVHDEAKLAKLVHEMADAGSGSADHLRQCFLTNIRTDQLRAACLPEIRE